MPQYDFPTTGPVRVQASVRASGVRITATDTATASVRLTGDDELAQRCHVDLTGDVLEIEVPQLRTGIFSGFGGKLRVEVVVPTGSSVYAKSGSGDLHLEGDLAEAELRAGSGSVEVSSAVRVKTDTGSGSVRIDRAGTVEANAGSGTISVTSAEDVIARVGSGGIIVDRSVRLRGTTGSGDLRIGETSMATLRTGSGSITVRLVRSGEVSATSASGGVSVGVADGTPTLLDCKSVSGRVRSELTPSGEPAEGEASVALRLRSTSGGITVHRA